MGTLISYLENLVYEEAAEKRVSLDEKTKGHEVYLVRI